MTKMLETENISDKKYYTLNILPCQQNYLFWVETATAPEQ